MNNLKIMDHYGSFFIKFIPSLSFITKKNEVLEMSLKVC